MGKRQGEFEFNISAYPSGIPAQEHSETSREAADSLLDEIRGIRKRVFEFVRGRGHLGATSDEVERGLGLRHQTASARLTELERLGFLERKGFKRRTSSGRKALVYFVSPGFQGELRE